jgi:hypothetical protein
MREAAEVKHWGTYVELDRPGRIAFNWILVDSQEDDQPSFSQRNLLQLIRSGGLSKSEYRPGATRRPHGLPVVLEILGPLHV